MGGKSRYNAMRSNQTEHFGIMGGLAPSTNVAQGVRRWRLKRARNRQTIPLMPIPGLQYMKEHDILSKNPAGSGGVGLTALLSHRAIGPCNCVGGPTASAVQRRLRNSEPEVVLSSPHSDGNTDGALSLVGSTSSCSVDGRIICAGVVSSGCPPGAVCNEQCTDYLGRPETLCTTLPTWKDSVPSAVSSFPNSLITPGHVVQLTGVLYEADQKTGRWLTPTHHGYTLTPTDGDASDASWHGGGASLSVQHSPMGGIGYGTLTTTVTVPDASIPAPSATSTYQRGPYTLTYIFSANDVHLGLAQMNKIMWDIGEDRQAGWRFRKAGEAWWKAGDGNWLRGGIGLVLGGLDPRWHYA